MRADTTVTRRDFLKLAVLGQGAVVLGAAGREDRAVGARRGHGRGARGFEYEESSIPMLQSALRTGKETSVSLCRKYLERIEAIDRHGPALRSVIEVNPDALRIARDLDRERRARGPRGDLHGIPILLKDNIDTADRMLTTAGSLALLGNFPAQDSLVALRLRQAGAVILGKTNLSEWANFRSNRSTSGWSARGGLTKNPYALDRNASGSSSGSAVAVAANLCAAAVGTETDGSIVSPAAVCGVVGIKPTVGLISRAGIIPISRTQDTAGPMARTVTDAAILLSGLTGVDRRDPVTPPGPGQVHPDYTRFLDARGLQGARLGIARRFFRQNAPGVKVMDDAISQLKSCGAVIVDPADLATHGKFGEAEYELMFYEFKAGLNHYLGQAGAGVAVRSLKDVIEFNERHREEELVYFGQENFLRAEAKGSLESEAYLKALEQSQRMSRSEGIDATIAEHKLDAIVAPSGGPAALTDLVYGDRGVGGSSSPAAAAGYPNITVPAGEFCGLPIGISFFGPAYSEPTLLKLAFAFEQATQARRAPRFPASVAER